MDTELESECNRIILLGMQQIKMLFIEGEIIKSKQRGDINDSQYQNFREVADKQWGKWSRRAKRLEQRTLRGR